MNFRLMTWTLPCSAFVAAFGLTQGMPCFGQANIAPGPARTVNQRIETETPPQLNADPSRAGLGRTSPGVNEPAGLDTAILIEHAVDMAIESSTMLAIAGPIASESSDQEWVKNLRNKAKKMMSESQTLLSQAAADPRVLASNPVLGRFHAAANLYVTTLAGLTIVSPVESSQVALINQSVKDVMDADHILQMSRMNTGSVALQQLKNHATSMKTQGHDMIRRLTNVSTTDNSASVNATALATRGKQLLEIADQLGRAAVISSTTGPANPGRFLHNQAEIIGGTYSNGSPRVGVYQGLGHTSGAYAPPALDEPSTIPTYSKQTTGSTGGVKPQ